MKQVFLAIFALLSVTLSAQTNLQYQAHIPGGSQTAAKFSVYIANETFDEDSHLNSGAFWYRENLEVKIYNGILNYLLENIPDSVFINNYGKPLFVYAYVNNTPIGKLQIQSVPYSLLSKYSLEAAEARTANFAERTNLAKRATLSDTATFSRSSIRAVYSDTALVSDTANYARHANTSDSAISSAYSDLAGYSANSTHSLKSDTAKFALKSKQSVYSDTTLYSSHSGISLYSETSAFAMNAKNASVTDTARFLRDSLLFPRNFARGSVTLLSLDGAETAQVGSNLTRGTNGISWEVNQHHRTSSVSIYTSAPASLPSSSRWIVSRVAVDYNLVAVSNPVIGQLVTIYNGSTANTVTLNNNMWIIDTAISCVILPNQSRTLWFNGGFWIVVQ
jgi:hypothetical protein